MAKIFNKKNSVKIDIPEGSKMVSFKLSDEAKKELESKSPMMKFPYSQFEKYLRGNKDISKLEENLKNVFFEKLPHETICKGCPKHDNPEAKQYELNCAIAWLEYQMLYILAGNNMDAIIKANAKVLRKEVKQRLIELFFTRAFEFKNAKTFFNVGEMIKFILKEGLKEISIQLKKMEVNIARSIASQNYHAIKEKMILSDLGEPGFEDFQKAEKKYWKNKKQELYETQPTSMAEKIDNFVELGKQFQNAWFGGKVPPATNKTPTPFNPKIDKELKAWIYPNNIEKFAEIETELFAQGFINATYKWQMGKGKGKRKLIDFIITIDKYIKPVVKRKQIQDFHKRQFFSERYGFGKTGLKDSWKKYQPSQTEAKVPFFWL